MNIIIYDDDAVQIQHLKMCLSKKDGVVLFFFCSGNELLNNLPDTCDIAILDIKSQDMFGATLSRTIKQFYPIADIVFISAYPQFVTEAIYVKASLFLIKPFEEKDFLNELNQIIYRRASNTFRWIVSNKTSVYAIHPADIIFVESYRRHLLIHTKDQTFDVCGMLQEAIHVLEAYGFICCHQSFLVGIRYIRQINSNDLLLSSGDHVPISSRRKKLIMEKCSQYMHEREQIICV